MLIHTAIFRLNTTESGILVGLEQSDIRVPVEGLDSLAGHPNYLLLLVRYDNSPDDDVKGRICVWKSNPVYNIGFNNTEYFGSCFDSYKFSGLPQEGLDVDTNSKSLRCCPIIIVSFGD